MATKITIEATINAPVEKVWKMWISPEHITKWNNASPEWHTPKSEVDLRVGGKYTSRMEAKDGSMGFDFWGTYTKINTNEHLETTMGDGRMWNTMFEPSGNTTKVIEVFEAENENSVDMQKMGWQSILNNFKSYVENN